jgi:hypothetical protein
MQKVLKELFDQFVKTNGREPDNLEMILIRQKASAEDIRKRKIISMFDRSPVDADKPILGGQNIEETDTQILERLNKGNEDSINRLKNKKDKPDDMATGGRAGYYGGGQAMVGEDLSDIGHGSDSLMARNMQVAPGSQATTSTGLNYLLGQDNDTARVPYKDGFSVQPFVSGSKSNQGFGNNTNVDLQDLTYGGNVMFDKGPFSVGIEHLKNKNKFDFKNKNNTIVKDTSDREDTSLLFAIDIANTIKGKARLNKEGGQFQISMPFAEGGRTGYKEAGPVVLPKKKPNSDFKNLLKIYNNYKDVMPGVSEDTQKYLAQDFINKLKEKSLSQTQFQTLRMQNHYEESKADGGRIGFRGGGSDASTTSFSKSYDSYSPGSNTASRANKTVDARQAAGGGSDDRSSPEQKINHFRAMNNAQQPKESKTKNIFNTGSEINYLKNLYKMDPVGLGISYGIKRYGPGAVEKLKGLFSEAELEEDQNGIMKMAELNDMQKKMLSGPQKQLKDIIGISNEEILQNISPFSTEETPATIDDVNKFYAAEGGPARQNFKMGKRAFLKFLGSGIAGIASLKTGLLGFGKEGGKKVAKEVVKEATGTPPAYFFKLVDKIRKLGDDAPKLAVKDKENVTTYKDYTLTEDITTGEQTIQRMKIDDDLKYDASEYYGKPVGEEVYMSYRPGKGLADETTKGKTPPDEYTEDTSLIRGDRPAEGEIMDTFDGVPNDIKLDANKTLVEEVMEQKIKIGKADGGRIGYAGGKKVVDAVIKKVNKKSGKKAVTTADKAEIPKETLLREMFTDTNKRLNKKREMTTNEYDDFVEEVGGADQLEAYNFDGTVGDAERILKEQEDYMAYMYEQYRMGKLDPVAGDKSPARKRFLEKKMEEHLMSGDSKLMTREEIDELYNFDLGTEMDKMKKIKTDEDIDISQGMIDLDELNFTSNAKAAKDKIDNTSINDEIKRGVAEIMSDTSPAALQKSIEIDNLMLKYPGMDRPLAEQIATSEPIKKADLIAMVEQTFKLSEQGKSGSEIIDIFKKTPRTKQATGGLASILG